MTKTNVGTFERKQYKAREAINHFVRKRGKMLDSRVVPIVKNKLSRLPSDRGPRINIDCWQRGLQHYAPGTV